MADEDISEEEFEAAKADLLRRLGAIPPSLQRVIDRGGRFARSAGRRFDAMVDGLDVYAPGSRVSDHGERERWHRDG